MVRLTRLVIWYIGVRWLMMVVFKAATDPIETVYVQVEGDISGLLDSVDKSTDQTKEKMKEVGGEAGKMGDKVAGGAGKAASGFRRVTSAISGIGKRLAAAGKSVLSFFSRAGKGADQLKEKTKGAGEGGALGAAKLGAAFGLAGAAAGKLLDVVINIASSAVQMFVGLGQQAIQLAGDFEQVQLTFKNIFGDEKQANEFLKGLQAESAKLGISFNEAGQFAKSLFPDTSDVEQFNELLRIGAVAAADANLPLSDLIFTLNNAVAGQFESIKEILDIPPDTLKELRAAPGDVDVLIGSLDKLFTKRGVNNLEEAQGTLQGLQRRIKGFAEELLLVSGLEVLGPLRDGFKGFFNILEANKPALTEVAAGIGEVVGIVVDFIKEDIFSGFSIKGPVEQLKIFVTWLKETLRAGLAMVGQLKSFAAAFAPLGAAIGAILKIAFLPLVNAFTQAKGGLSRLDEAFITAAQVMAGIGAVIKGLTANFDGLWASIQAVGRAFIAFVTGDFATLKSELAKAGNEFNRGLQDGADAFEKSILDSASNIDRIINPVKKLKEEKESTPTAEDPEETVKVDEAAAKKLEALSDQLIDATEDRNEKLADLEKSHVEKVQDIAESAARDRLAIEEQAAQDLIDNDKESEKQRLKIIGDARESLAKLSKDTDSQIDEQRSEFQKDELRDTEDHMREMRQLTDKFLNDLEGAVRDRDAGAIVDLQRNFNAEKSEREEDFSIKQDRGTQDQDQELAGIRDAESKKREEILTSQAEQLSDLKTAQEEKRAEILADKDRELAELDQKLLEDLTKENESFMARQAQLDEALQKKLESIAENLAKEKDVTAEGAQAILETLDETFGIGGDIDKMMTDFAARRSLKAEIEINFKKKSGVSEPTETSPTTPGDALRSGLAAPGGTRLGGVQAFADGGTLVANKPTLALFGEKVPEVAQFTPLSEISSGGGGGSESKLSLEFSGSAPPGIGLGERDQIAAVLLAAIRETGALS